MQNHCYIPDRGNLYQSTVLIILPYIGSLQAVLILAEKGITACGLHIDVVYTNLRIRISVQEEQIVRVHFKDLAGHKLVNIGKCRYFRYFTDRTTSKIKLKCKLMPINTVFARVISAPAYFAHPNF
jgi:hypothetical protein